MNQIKNEGTDGLLRAANCVYLACEQPVADDISARLKWAAGEIERLTAELQEWKDKYSLEIQEVNARADMVCWVNDELTAELEQYRQQEADGRILPPFCDDDYNGLKVKYRVYKARNGEPVEDCFVLRPQKDMAACTALAMYAQKCGNEQLRVDVLNWLQDITREAAEQAKGDVEK